MLRYTIKHTTTKAIVGSVAKGAQGWRFITQIPGRRPGRKAHDRWRDALPRWCRSLGCEIWLLGYHEDTLIERIGRRS